MIDPSTCNMATTKLNNAIHTIHTAWFFCNPRRVSPQNDRYDEFILATGRTAKLVGGFNHLEKYESQWEG